jgi:cell division topological specificity factor
MKLLDFFRKQPPSAPQARERLQILLAHERSGKAGADFLPDLQRELIAVVKKYVAIDDDKVQVQLDRNDEVQTLEVNVEIPDTPAEDRPRRRSA